MDVDLELDQLQQECDAEKLAGIQDAPKVEQQVEQAVAKPQVAANNLDDLL